MIEKSTLDWAGGGGGRGGGCQEVCLFVGLSLVFWLLDIVLVPLTRSTYLFLFMSLSPFEELGPHFPLFSHLTISI